MDNKDMQALATFALDVARGSGASYADVRLIITETQILSTKNLAVVGIDEADTFGIGIRVLWNNLAWGFASTPHVTKRSVEKTVRRAVANAKESARLALAPIVFAPEPAHKDSWSSPCLIDPFKVATEDKVALLLSAAENMLKVKGVEIATGMLEFRRTTKFFASTEGSEITQTIVTSGCDIQAQANGDDDYQLRSYPFCLGGQYENRGYEMLKTWDLPGNAERIGSEAVAILKAPFCPEGTWDVIVGGAQLAMQLHESAGHPTELDREDGWEQNYAGGTFLTRDKLNSFRYGSKHVNIVADGTAAGGLGSYKYDDEGVEAQRYDLVNEGIFCGFLTSRETASLIGRERSGGAMRASTFADQPLIRMTNVTLLPGEGTLDQLINDTKRGLLLDTCTSWSIDSQREHFQFSTEIGWVIKDGKKSHMVRMPSYEGFTAQFWNSCDAVCGCSEHVLWGCDSCAKGQPEQAIGTGHGASPARFRKVKVGVAQREED
jgi:Predicted Zn-dependent proteases and their inactivated homologs